MTVYASSARAGGWDGAAPGLPRSPHPSALPAIFSRLPSDAELRLAAALICAPLGLTEDEIMDLAATGDPPTTRKLRKSLRSKLRGEYEILRDQHLRWSIKQVREPVPSESIAK